MQSFSVYFTASNLKFYTLARAMKSNTILDPLPILHFIKNEKNFEVKHNKCRRSRYCLMELIQLSSVYLTSSTKFRNDLKYYTRWRTMKSQRTQKIQFSIHYQYFLLQKRKKFKVEYNEMQ